jgi:hypothetical protein
VYPFILELSGSDRGGRQRDEPEDVNVESPLNLRLLGCSSPKRGCQLQDATGGPARQEAEEVAQVRPRFESLQLAAGEERCERGVDLAGVVVADERIEDRCEWLVRSGLLDQLELQLDTPEAPYARVRNTLLRVRAAKPRRAVPQQESVVWSSAP